MEWVWRGERQVQCRGQWNGFGEGRDKHNVEASGMGLERGETSTGTMKSPVEWVWKGEIEAQCRVQRNGFGNGRKKAQCRVGWVNFSEFKITVWGN